MAHDRDHRRARLVFASGRGFFFLEEGFRVVELGRHRGMAHFLDQDHGGFLIELLVDGDHLAQLHQMLDQLAGLDRHLVRQVGHADGFGHVHFLHREFGRRVVAVAAALAVVAAPCTARRAPTRPAGTAVGARLQRALLRRIVGPAGGQLFGLERLLVARLGGRGRSSRRSLGLVDRAGDAFLAGVGRLGRLGRLGHLHALGPVHHRADGRGFGFGLLAAAVQVGQALLVFGLDGRSLDDAQNRLRCLGHGFGSRWRGWRRLAVLDFLAVLGLCGLRQRGFRCCRGLFTRAHFSGFALGAFLFFAQTAALGKFCFLHTDSFGLRFGFGLATLQFGLFGFGCGRRGGFVHAGRHIVALDEDALLAHLDLDAARLAAGIGLLDLAGRPARQRDLLALGADGAVGVAQKLEQAFLVGFGQCFVRGALRNPGRLQLLEQRRRGAVQLRG